MHEMTLVSSIFTVIEEKIKELNVKKVTQVKLIVGEMTGVEDMTMKGCFELFAEATPVEGAELIIERVPIKAQCQACKKEFAARSWVVQCPDCKGTSVKIVSGKELYIDSMEVE